TVTATVTVTPAANGCTGTAKIFTITVSPSPTIATAGSPKTITGTTGSVVLEGNTPVTGTGAWSVVSGPSTINAQFNNTTNPTATFTPAPGTGTYQLKWTISNLPCTASEATVAVTVTGGNSVPVARAGKDTIITVSPATALLNGSASSDADGTIAAFLWNKISGSQNAQIASPNSAVTSITNLTDGDYLFELRVTDNNSAVSADTVKVTVTGRIAIVNFSFNAGSSFATLAPALAPNITCSAAGSAVFSTATGSGSGSNAFTPNPTGNAVSTDIDNSLTFTLAGSNLSNYKTFRVYYLAQKPTIGTNTITVAYSKNGAAFTSAGIGAVLGGNPVSLQTTGTPRWTEVLVNLPVAADNPISSLAIRLTINNASSGTIKVDNFQVQAVSTAPLQVTSFSGNTLCGAANPGQLVMTATGGTDPYTVVYNDGVANRTAANVVSGVVFNAFTNPVATTNYTLVSVTDSKGFVRTSGFTDATATITVTPVPTVNDVSNQTICRGTATTSIIFGGTVSGTTYSWTNNTSSVGLAASGTGNIASFTGLNAGASTVTATVTVTPAANGCTGTAKIFTITVSPSPTIATAGSPKTITGTTGSVVLEGNTPVTGTGAWSVVSGPSTINAQFNNTTNPTATFTPAPGTGTYQLKWTISNLPCTASEATVAVTVTGGNSVPVARAGKDTIITVSPATALLNGSASSDADGTIAAFLWNKISGSQNAQIASPNSAVTSITNLTDGDYLFELRVTDNNSAVSADTVKVTVITVAANDSDMVNCGRQFTIVVLGSSTAFGTGATPVDSSFVNKYAAYIKRKNVQSKIINLAVPGFNSYHVLCPDGFVPVGNRPAPDSGNNISQAIRLHPDAILINLPSNDAVNNYSLQEQQANFERAISLAEAEHIPVWATTTQPRNNLATQQVDNLKLMRDWILGRFGNKAVDFWTGVANADGSIVSQYNFDNVHVNNAGHTILYKRCLSETIVDSLCNSFNPAPIANAGIDIYISLPQNSTGLNGRASSDVNGSITAYQWTKISGPEQFVINDDTSGEPTLTNLKEGIYVWKLKVTDNSGAQSLDTVMVSVMGMGNNLPVAMAGNDTTLILPLNSITLNGNASTDPGGTITSYLWTKIAGPSNYQIADPASAITVVKNLSEGLYSFVLGITDNNGAVNRDTVTISVGNRILIDIGAGSLTASPDAMGKYWNNMPNAQPGIRVQNAITTSNLPTTVKLEVVNRIDGTFNNAETGVGVSTTMGQVGDYPPSATIDYAFASPTTTSGRWKFTGLDSLKQYSIKFWGTRSAATRFTQIKRTDETNWSEFDAGLNTDFNRAVTFTFSGKAEMSFDIRVKAGSTFGYISVIDIKSFSLNVVRARSFTGNSQEVKHLIAVPENTKQELIFYPNPTNGTFKIAGYPIMQTSPVSIQVVNGFGQQVYQRMANSVNGIIEVKITGKVSAGIYFVNCVVNGQKFTRKIFIQK
ncbi:MAG: GDSL-type esterase/lipase family protein, partial [Ferruginibacter sp.]